MPQHPIGAGKSSFELIDSDKLFKAMAVTPEMTVLDLACGAGQYTLALARQAQAPQQIIAIDLWAEGIASLQQSARSIPAISINTHVADIRQKLPLSDATVDICLMAAVLHDLVRQSDPLPILNEIIRVLKPVGILAVAEFKKQEGPPGPPKANRLRLEEVSALLLKVGLIRYSAVVELGPDIYFTQFKRLMPAVQRHTP